jgi:Zn-dependent alcohol dehydrogenase
MRACVCVHWCVRDREALCVQLAKAQLIAVLEDEQKKLAEDNAPKVMGRASARSVCNASSQSRRDDDDLDKDPTTLEESQAGALCLLTRVRDQCRHAEYAAWRLRELARVKREMINHQVCLLRCSSSAHCARARTHTD